MKKQKQKKPWALKPKKHWGLASIGERNISIQGHAMKEKVNRKSTNHS
jgi:hypothetical protein